MGGIENKIKWLSHFIWQWNMGSKRKDYKKLKRLLTLAMDYLRRKNEEVWNRLQVTQAQARKERVKVVFIRWVITYAWSVISVANKCGLAEHYCYRRVSKICIVSIYLTPNIIVQWQIYSLQELNISNRLILVQGMIHLNSYFLCTSFWYWYIK